MFDSTAMVYKYVDSKIRQFYGVGLHGNEKIVVWSKISNKDASWRIRPSQVKEDRVYVFPMTFPVELGLDPIVWIETGKRLLSNGGEWSPVHFQESWSMPGLNANELPRSGINRYDRLAKYLNH